MKTLAPAVRTLLALIAGASFGAALAAELPVVDGSPAVATVNGEPIWLKDVEREITMLHATQEEGDRKAGRQNPAKILDRMITARLLAQEARNIGLDEQPEGKQELERARLETLRDLYNREVLKEVPADPAVVQRIFRAEVGEFRVRSILFAKEPDMKEFQAKLKSGMDFDTAVVTFGQSGKGQVGNPKDWLKASQMQSVVVQAMEKLKPNQVSPALKLEAGWAFFRLLEARYPENPEAKERARMTAEGEARNRKLAAHIDALRKKMLTFDEKAIAALDLDKPGAFEAARKDTRPLVKIAGAAPITVADLAVALEKRFFHGIDKAIEAKRLNAEKRTVLEDLVNRRIVVLDAQRMGIDKSREFDVVVERKMNAWLFGAIVQRVIVPEVKLQKADLEKYMKDHQAEFMSPAMIAVESLAFDDRKAADEALGKLQRGADFAWLKANTPGQTAKTNPKLFPFAPGLFVESAFPESLQKALVGARAGDYRFSGDEGGPYYVVHVLRREAAKPAAFEAVQEQIAKLVYQEKIGQKIDEWGGKLRQASEVKTFATGDELLKLVMRDLTGGN
jgi:parvulin-like peptidyl-prolyl isomerase